MRINTNLTAMNTYGQYTANNNKIAGSVAKLSSGYAINTAADNATGLAISEKMRAQIRGLSKAQTNAQDAISLVQTAEGALNSSTEILQRMRELAVQSSSDTNENQIDRTALQDEFSQLQKELDDIAGNTTFNKKNLLDGSLSATTKNLGSTTLGNSGMTVQLGNANTGTYNFSVSTKLVSAAVEKAVAATPELVLDGAESYFSGGTNTVALGSKVEASDLLNGNYTLKATYADPTNDKGDGQIKVTATGDNGQKFQATITKADLEGLSTGTNLQIKFNASADDAFNISLNLTNNVAVGESNYDTLASNISKLSVSVTGGVSARDAEYGVFANLTGAESVKLESGMDSVTFDNGVKINFNKLTASSVDTSNQAVGVGTVTTSAYTDGTTSMSLTDFKALDDAEIANGNWAITTTEDAVTGLSTFTATDGTSSYKATAKTADLEKTAVGTYTNNLTFSDATTGQDIFSATLTQNVTVAATAGGTDSADIVANMQVSNSGHNYSKTFGDAAVGGSINAKDVAAGVLNNGTTGTFSNFVAGAGSSVAVGDLTVSFSSTAATQAGSVTITATDKAGNSYASQFTGGFGDDGAAVISAVAGTSTTTTLSFVDNNNAANTFTLDLTTIAGAGGANNGVVNSTTSTVSVNADLNASTDSSFGVEETANAGLTFQVGANEGDEMVINIEKMDANYLGVASASVGTRTAATAAIGVVDSAINQVSSQRAYLGAIQNRLDYKISNLNTSTENLTSAESQIRDVDMAKEMTNFTNANILQQAATAMLAQANSLPQNVLSLIGK